MISRDAFDNCIGRLDRILSEMMLLSKDNSLDLSDRKTLEHHGEDMIGAGQKIVDRMKPKNEP